MCGNASQYDRFLWFGSTCCWNNGSIRKENHVERHSNKSRWNSSSIEQHEVSSAIFIVNKFIVNFSHLRLGPNERQWRQDQTKSWRIKWTNASRIPRYGRKLNVSLFSPINYSSFAFHVVTFRSSWHISCGQHLPSSIFIFSILFSSILVFLFLLSTLIFEENKITQRQTRDKTFTDDRRVVHIFRLSNNRSVS